MADFRQKDVAQELLHLSAKLLPGGLLLLGSIDEVSARPACLLQNSSLHWLQVFEGAERGPQHSLSILEKLFTRVQCEALESYPHIYRLTHHIMINKLAKCVIF